MNIRDFQNKSQWRQYKNPPSGDLRFFFKRICSISVSVIISHLMSCLCYLCLCFWTHCNSFGITVIALYPLRWCLRFLLSIMTRYRERTLEIVPSYFVIIFFLYPTLILFWSPKTAAKLTNLHFITDRCTNLGRQCWLRHLQDGGHLSSFGEFCFKSSLSM